MGKGNDKKVVKETRDLLLCTLGNLMESHRERRFTKTRGGTSLSRKEFCSKFNLEPSTIAHIETGRFLQLRFEQLRIYLATIYGRNDANFTATVKKVYEGMKELDKFLKKL